MPPTPLLRPLESQPAMRPLGLGSPADLGAIFPKRSLTGACVRNPRPARSWVVPVPPDRPLDRGFPPGRGDRRSQSAGPQIQSNRMAVGCAGAHRA